MPLGMCRRSVYSVVLTPPGQALMMRADISVEGAVDKLLVRCHHRATGSHAVELLASAAATNTAVGCGREGGALDEPASLRAHLSSGLNLLERCLVLVQA